MRAGALSAYHGAAVVVRVDVEYCLAVDIQQHSYAEKRDAHQRASDEQKKAPTDAVDENKWNDSAHNVDDSNDAQDNELWGLRSGEQSCVAVSIGRSKGDVSVPPPPPGIRSNRHPRTIVKSRRG